MQRDSRALLQAFLRSVQSATRGKTACQGRPASLPASLEQWLPQHQPANPSCYLQASAKLLSSASLSAFRCHRSFASQAQASSQSAYRGQQPRQRRTDASGTQGLYLVAFTVAMIGVTYASVPLYRMFCQATGYGGTVQQGSTGESCTCFQLLQQLETQTETFLFLRP